MSECLTHTALKMAPNRRMCNELVRELCLKIPTAKTSDRILLTAHNLYAYLAPGFSKKLIYRDAIAFLKANLNAKKNGLIFIHRLVHQNNGSEPIVVINKEQSEENFELETNKFHIRIRFNCKLSQNEIYWDYNNDHFMNAYLQHFLPFFAPLLPPIRLWLGLDGSSGISSISTAKLVHFLNTQSDWIDSIQIWNHYFDSGPFIRALRKCNRLEFYGSLSPLNVQKLIQWLNSNNNNNGQPKKCRILLDNEFNGGLALLIDGLKKEFGRATNTRRFDILLHLRQWSDEFTLCNEVTGEILQLRRKNFENEWCYIHALTRSPDNGLEDNENGCVHLGTFTEIYLC